MSNSEKPFTLIYPEQLHVFMEEVTPVWLGGISVRDELAFITHIDNTSVSYKPFLSATNQEFELQIKDYGGTWFAYQYIKEKERIE